MNWTEGWARQRIITLFAQITNDAAKDTISQMWGYAAVSSEAITLLINSPGGEVPHALAIVQAMKACPVKVNTIAMGRVFSGGVIVLVAGHIRKAFPRTLFMTHEFQNIKEDGAGYRSLKRSRKSDDWTYETLVNHFTDYTKLSVPEVRKKLLSTEFYFDENKAIKMGIIDKIITDKISLYDENGVLESSV